MTSAKSLVEYRMAGLEQLQRRADAWIERLQSGIDVLVAHERAALAGHWSEVGERLAVARRARSAGELLRDQFDLFPESRARLRRDHCVRRALLRGVINELAGEGRTSS